MTPFLLYKDNTARTVFVRAVFRLSEKSVIVKIG